MVKHPWLLAALVAAQVVIFLSVWIEPGPSMDGRGVLSVAIAAAVIVLSGIREEG